MRIAVPLETAANEARVAATPEAVKKLIGLGAEVVVQSGAGKGSGLLDADYKNAGASIALGAALLAIMDPYDQTEALKGLAHAGVDAFAMELMPRITRAPSVDVLSSQANLAGYRAVLEAAAEYGRAIPMMMIAAGAIPAAKIFIMGVAGLQAIAMARRLGGIITAIDVRPATKEQVESLGAKFLAVEDEEFKQAQTASGYAKEMSWEYQAKQAALTATHIAKQDIVITTALIPGRPAPQLISAEMVASKRPGSVIVDLAVERGGNCALSKPDEVVVTENGVRIVGHLNMPSRLAATASALYAKNLYAFLETLIEDESLNGCLSMGRTAMFGRKARRPGRKLVRTTAVGWNLIADQDAKIRRFKLSAAHPFAAFSMLVGRDNCLVRVNGEYPGWAFRRRFFFSVAAGKDLNQRQDEARRLSKWAVARR